MKFILATFILAAAIIFSSFKHGRTTISKTNLTDTIPEKKVSIGYTLQQWQGKLDTLRGTMRYIGRTLNATEADQLTVAAGLVLDNLTKEILANIPKQDAIKPKK